MRLYSIYSQLYITKLLYARPMKTITLCTFFKLVFVVGTILLLLLLITVCSSQGGKLLPIHSLHSLNEIQTRFSQLSKRSASFSPADLCTDYAHYVKNHRLKQNHGGPRRDCFSLLHFGKSQFSWFYVAFQT